MLSLRCLLPDWEMHWKLPIMVDSTELKHIKCHKNAIRKIRPPVTKRAFQIKGSWWPGCCSYKTKAQKFKQHKTAVQVCFLSYYPIPPCSWLCWDSKWALQCLWAITGYVFVSVVLLLVQGTCFMGALCSLSWSCGKKAITKCLWSLQLRQWRRQS